MPYFLRYTESPTADLSRGVSYHLAGDIQHPGTEWNEYFKGYAQELPGLCAFELDAETLEDAIEEAMEFKYNATFRSDSGDSWAIFSGVYLDDCPEGIVFRPEELLYIHKGQYFSE